MLEFVVEVNYQISRFHISGERRISGDNGLDGLEIIADLLNNLLLSIHFKALVFWQ